MAYYVFSLNEIVLGRSEQISVLYRYANGDFDIELAETIDNETNRRLPPNRIVIVCRFCELASVLRDLYNNAVSLNDRLRVTTHISILPFDYLGRLVEKSQHSFRGEGWRPSDQDLNRYLREGMRTIIERTGTIMQAPAGYLFKKPSGDTHSIFIRAGNMLRDHEALSVIFHALSRTIKKLPSRIYIDSFTILPIATEFQQGRQRMMMSDLETKSVPTIINFHSYAIDSGLRFPLNDDYIVLISASSSGGLAKILCTDHGARESSIYHVLLYSAKNSYSERAAYFQLQDKPRRIDPFMLKQINIPGEEFMASHGKTRAVSIKKRHVPKKPSQFIKDVFYAEHLKIRLGGQHDASFAPFGISSDKKLGCPTFQTWLNTVCFSTVSCSTDLIIYVDDERSRALADQVLSILKGRFGKTPKLVGILDAASTDCNSSILVVCADESTGEKLFSASRALRNVPHMHIHYLVGHIFAETAQTATRIHTSITMSGKDDHKYGVSVFSVIPVGDPYVHSSWQFECDINPAGEQIDKLNPSFVSFIEKRQRLKTQGSLSTEYLFFPSVNGVPLTLRHGSVLFDGEYNNVSQVQVYLMVSTALQNARDKRDSLGKVLDDEDCFDNNPFLETVLDPDTLSKFNDGVIQASFLRACTAPELNYGRDFNFSRQMSELFRTVFTHPDLQTGEACIEFLFCLVTKKVKFVQEHQQMLDKVVSEDKALSVLSELFKNSSPF